MTANRSIMRSRSQLRSQRSEECNTLFCRIALLGVVAGLDRQPNSLFGPTKQGIPREWVRDQVEEFVTY